MRGGGDGSRAGGRGDEGGGLAGRQRGRARVWREDREIDRITGFKSRTEREMARDKGKKRERGKERSGLRRLTRLAKIEKINTLNSYFINSSWVLCIIIHLEDNNFRNSTLNIHSKC